MSDNEIKKALECCADEHRGCTDYCPYVGKISCAFDLRKDALDLINRQQAEIERLEGELIEERTRRENAVNAYHEAKIEAIKEFAERLKELLKKKRKKAQSLLAKSQYGECILAVDNLVKEMTESPTKIEHGSLCETDTYEVKE